MSTDLKAVCQGNDSKEVETIPKIEIIPKIEETEEKEISNEAKLEFCKTIPQTPLAVPMVADTLQQSVTRSDAKAITETRLKRLKELSQRPEDGLSKRQKDEKRRIIRLEKNRRAAAMSRRKKKMYVKGLEEKCNLMQRHLAILEMENSHLRVMLNASANRQNIPPNMGNMQNVPPKFLHSNPCSNENTNTNTNTTNSLEPANSDISESEPAFKRRRLNDGSTHTNTPSLSCSNSPSEMLPMSNASSPPPMPMAYMPVPPHMHHHGHPHQHPQLLQAMHAHGHGHPHPHPHPHAHGHPQMIPYPPSMPHPHMIPQHMMQPKQERDECSVPPEMDMQSDMPPEIVVPKLSIANDFLSIMDDSDNLDETVDGFGSVLEFKHELYDIHQNSPGHVYP